MKHIKQILFIGCLLLTSLSCKAQLLGGGDNNSNPMTPITIPVEDVIPLRNSEPFIPDGSKVKDVNNLLEEYVGTWVGTHNGMTIELRIVEHTWISDDPQSQIIENDELILRYKLTDSNGTVVEDTTNLAVDEVFVVHGNYLAETGSPYVFSFYTRAERCELAGDFFVSVGWDNNPNKMKAHVTPDNDMGISGGDPNCPNGYVQTFIPRLPQMTLMKQ